MFALKYDAPTTALADYDYEATMHNTEGRITEFMRKFGLSCDIVHVTHASAVSKYHIALDNINSIGKEVGAAKKLSALLNVPVTAKPSNCAHFCFEIVRHDRLTVRFNEKFIMESGLFEQPGHLCPFVLGVDTDNRPMVTNLKESVHILLCGKTGGGKSVCLHTILSSLSLRTNPNQLEIHGADFKRVELSKYRTLPHVVAGWDSFCKYETHNRITPTAATSPIIDNLRDLSKRLNYLVDTMEHRYRILEEYGFEEIPSSVNRILLVIDELGDAMLVGGKAIEEPLVRLMAKGRACGIHVILSTQRPEERIASRLIRANAPTRIALKVSDHHESKLILGIEKAGAEKLAGNGDAIILYPGNPDPVRFQGPYISNEDVKTLVSVASDYWHKGG